MGRAFHIPVCTVGAVCRSLLALSCIIGTADAQQSGAQPPSACWRFAFGEWAPPLDWAKAGQPGEVGQTASTIQRIRDSVYVKDSVAAHNNAMTWEKTDHGLLLLLYPPWWPAGVEVTFDSTLAEGKGMVGTAVAMVANTAQPSPRARARAWQVTCGGEER